MLAAAGSLLLDPTYAVAAGGCLRPVALHALAHGLDASRVALAVAVVPRARLHARCSSNGNDRVKASGKSPKSGKAATRRASIKGARDPGEDASRDF